MDILRGFALLGMLLVHLYDHSGEGSGWEAALQSGIGLFVSGKAHATFTFLFGVGFAIQLRRAGQRRVPFEQIYLRRLAVLALFGFAAHALLGFNVLLGYAVWGVPLLLIRNWSTRALIVTVGASALSWVLYNVGIGLYEWAVYGWDGSGQAWSTRMEVSREAWSRVSGARAQESYAALVATRLEHMAWFYRQPWFVLPYVPTALFTLGVLAVRAGVFDDPRRHTRLILGAMITGLGAWAATNWLLPRLPVFAPAGVMEPLRNAWWTGQWLMFTYVGGLVLLLAYRKEWERRLVAFAWAGRMALTLYLLQILTLDWVVSAYAFGVGQIAPALIVPGTFLFFGAQVWFSCWWLARYRFGPAEWLWRSLTYGGLQPMRIREPATVPVRPALGG